MKALQSESGPIMADSNIALVVPVYNEDRFIRNVITGIPQWLHWIIVIDDASTDDSYRILQQIDDPRLVILSHPTNRGVGAAIVTGYRKAIEFGARAAVVMAGDGQMDPADLEAVTEPILNNWADYVKGNRFIRDRQRQVRGNGSRIPLMRRVGIRFFTILTRIMSGTGTFDDAQCGFTAASISMLKQIDLDLLTERYGFPNEMILNVLARGFRMAEVPVRPIYGREQSGIRVWKDLPRMAWRIIRKGRQLHRIRSSKTGSRPRLIILATCFPRFAGDHAGSFIATLAKHLDGSIPVIVIAPDAPGAVWCPENVNVRRFRWSGWSRSWSMAYGNGILENIVAAKWACFQIPLFIFAMRKALIGEYRRGDKILSHWLFPSAWIASGVLASPGKNTGSESDNDRIFSPSWTHLAVAHGSDVRLLERFSPIVTGRVTAAIGRCCDGLIVVSNDLKERLGRLFSNATPISLRVTPMGIDYSAFSEIRERRGRKCTTRTGIRRSILESECDPEAGETRRILFLGRLIPIKGVDVLIQAIGCNEALRNACLLIIAGDGPERVHLERMADMHRIRSIFTGHVTGRQKDELIINADLAVVPSIVTDNGNQDGTPLVALEFMASGIPLIASRSCGLADIVIHRENGMLVDPGDPAQLASQMTELIGDGCMAQRIIENGYKTAERFDVKVLSSKLVNSTRE